MSRWQEYHTPTTVAEALAILARMPHQARIVAGGTDLLLDLELGHEPPVRTLVDITHIPELREIREEEGDDGPWIWVGAAVTHGQIERDPLLRRVATCLAEGCSVVGGPQVRHVATLGGNVAHALPAADGTIGLLALDAQVQIATWQEGEVTYAWQPLPAVFAGPGRNTLQPNQMLTAFRFRPTGPGEGSAFDRIMRPQGVALPILGAAVRLRLSPHRDLIEHAVIALGPAGPVPFRATAAERALRGARPNDPQILEQAIHLARQEARLRTSKHRATAAYRHEMVAVLLRRLIPRAANRARQFQQTLP